MRTRAVALGLLASPTRLANRQFCSETSGSGQTEKNSVRAYVFRSTLDSGHWTDWHLRDCGKVRGRLVGALPSRAVRYQGAKVQPSPRAKLLDLSQDADNRAVRNEASPAIRLPDRRCTFLTRSFLYSVDVSVCKLQQACAHQFCIRRHPALIVLAARTFLAMRCKTGTVDILDRLPRKPSLGMSDFTLIATQERTSWDV
jgi:hypothetical protein